MDNYQLAIYPKLKEVFDKIIVDLQETLGSKFIGLYLQGSLAIGDFDRSSDVDFIIATSDELSSREVTEWQLRHEQIYDQDNRWVKRLEYSFFPIQMLKKLSSPYPKEHNRDTLWYYDNGSRTVEKSDHCNSIVVRWTLREKGIVLFGPHPKTIIPSIPANVLRNEIKNTIIGWGEELIKNPDPYQNRFYQSYLVLNFSRMLHDLLKGRVSSKLTGIKWAKKQLPEKWKDHFDFCWEERTDTTISVNQVANPESFKRSMEFVKYVVDKSKQYKIKPLTSI